MKTQTFRKATPLPVTAAEAFAWHEREGAIERLSPPWEKVTLIERTGGLGEGGRVVFRLHMGPLHRDWVALHGPMIEGREFRDTQVSGPFASWDHVHRFEDDPNGGSRLVDEISYRVPLGAVGAFFGGGIARRKIGSLFAYRHAITAGDLAHHLPYREKPPMKILITGSTGMVGSALIPLLTTGGHKVTRVVRRAAGAGEIQWDPISGFADGSALEGFDAVIHLAGENIAGRWTAAKKARIMQSRAEGTARLAKALAGLKSPPRVLVCASAIGYYGDREAGEKLTEASAAGTHGFLPEVVQAWEGAADPARAAGIRTVHLRFGVILSPAGGALAQMLTPFKLGLGGPLGTGRQMMSWITLDDAITVISHAMQTEGLSGPVNAVAPGAVTNAEFTRVLGRVLRRPAFLPMPTFAARIVFGQMGEELLLAGANVVPEKLRETGYAFGYPDLERALRHLLGRTPDARTDQPG